MSDGSSVSAEEWRIRHVLCESRRVMNPEMPTLIFYDSYVKSWEGVLEVVLI